MAYRQLVSNDRFGSVAAYQQFNTRLAAFGREPVIQRHNSENRDFEGLLSS
jgi:hypothetical protein